MVRGAPCPFLSGSPPPPTPGTDRGTVEVIADLPSQHPTNA